MGDGRGCGGGRKGGREEGGFVSIDEGEEGDVWMLCACMYVCMYVCRNMSPL